MWRSLSLIYKAPCACLFSASAPDSLCYPRWHLPAGPVRAPSRLRAFTHPSLGPMCSPCPFLSPPLSPAARRLLPGGPPAPSSPTRSPIAAPHYSFGALSAMCDDDSVICLSAFDYRSKRHKGNDVSPLVLNIYQVSGTQGKGNKCWATSGRTNEYVGRKAGSSEVRSSQGPLEQSGFRVRTVCR